MKVSTESHRRELRVALIGGGLMAKSHSLAYGAVPNLYPDLGVVPRLSVLADATDELAAAAAERLGFERWTSDWREAVSSPDIDIVDIVTPNWLHFEVAMAAIEAGKHVYCEKPLAITAAEARQMWDAARAAGVVTIVGFSYLSSPGLQVAKNLVADGTLGEIWSVRAHFLVDANADPRLPRSWHYERGKAGMGALGDIGSHMVSIVEAVAGAITEVFGELSTVVPQRPLADGATSYGSSAAADAPLADVENDDHTIMLARLANGARGIVEVSRVANGHPFDLSFEVIGSLGSVRFEQQDAYKVQLFLRGDAASGFTGPRTVTLGPDHPNYAAFWPFPGVPLGLHELKTVDMRNFLAAIAEGGTAYPSFEQGWRVIEVLEATERSSATGAWVEVAR